MTTSLASATGLPPTPPRRRPRTAWSVLRLEWPGYAADVWGDSPAVIRAVRLLWPVLGPPHRLPVGLPVDRYSLTGDDTTAATPYRLCCGNHPATVHASLGAALVELERHLSARRVDGLAETHLLVEAAVLGTPAGVTVIPGPLSHARAALTVTLLRAGYDLISDTLLVIDVRGQRLLACLGPLQIPEADWPRLVAPLRRRPAVWSAPSMAGEAWRLVAPMRTSLAERAWPPRQILVPTPTNPPGTIEPLTPGQALLALAAPALNLPCFGERGLGALACLAEGASSYAVADAPALTALTEAPVMQRHRRRAIVGGLAPTPHGQRRQSSRSGRAE